MTQLIIWRHGQTSWNFTDRIQGHTDVPLDEVGRAQAAAAAVALAKLHPDVLVASDLRRAADTAQALAAETGLPVHLDDRLRERYFGSWQGMTAAEVATKYEHENALWRSGQPINAFGIESLDDLATRVTNAARDAVARADGGTVVVATHGGAAKHIISGLVGWPPDVVARLVGLANCHWSDLRHDPIRGWVLRSHNVGRTVD